MAQEPTLQNCVPKEQFGVTEMYGMHHQFIVIQTKDV